MNKLENLRSILESESAEPILLLSIQPQFSELIRKGVKTVELRKKKPKKESRLALIYESFPKKSASLLIKLKNIDYSPLHRIWTKYGRKTGISKKYFGEYYRNSEHGAAFLIDSVFELKKEIGLETLYRYSLSPPQDYRYISKDVMAQMLELQNLH